MTLQINLSYVEQQGLIDALELYMASEKVLRNGGTFDGGNYLSTQKAKQLIEMLVDDLSEAVTSTIVSGRSQLVSRDPVTITYLEALEDCDNDEASINEYGRG